MSLSMYSASVPTFVRTLNSMLVWFDKAEAYAKEKGFEPDNYLGLRFAPDMFAFCRQVQIASDASKGCVARLAGIEMPSWPDEESTFPELRERIQKTIDFVGGLSTDQIDGSEDREIELPIGPDASMTFTGQAFLTGFALPNFFFHATNTYTLLRQAGVPLGKMDFLGKP